MVLFDVETSEWGSYSFAQMNTHFYPVDTIICYLAVITSRYDLCSGSSLHTISSRAPDILTH